MGNLCFSFISPVPKGVLPLDTKQYHFGILQKSFKNLGFEVETQGRNDMIYQGKKFSGSAFEVDLGGKSKQPKVLHHGTILMETNLERMINYLNPNIHKLKSKGIDSVKARVINLKEANQNLTKEKIIEETSKIFYEEFGNNIHLQVQYLDEQFFKINPEANDYLKQLESKEFILGEQGTFTNEFETRFEWGVVEVKLNIENGTIKKTQIYSDSLHPDFIDLLNNKFNSMQPYYESHSMDIIENEIKKELKERDQLEMLNQFFGWLKKCVKGEQLFLDYNEQLLRRNLNGEITYQLVTREIQKYFEYLYSGFGKIRSDFIRIIVIIF